MEKRFELHSHTKFSDGAASIDEMVLKARELNNAIAVTDHILDMNFKNFLKNREIYGKIYPDVIFGVEITRVKPEEICKIAKEAYNNSMLVIVHGETPGDFFVPKGTNKAAVECEYVDILAHPGFISEEEARKAKDNEVLIELSARKIHNSSNKKIAKLCKDLGVKMVVNTDSHSPDELITYEDAMKIALDSGLSMQEAWETNENARRIFERFKV